ncbi:MAG TPA: S8 family peptidase [Candidatus Paceibacterota bacterium]
MPKKLYKHLNLPGQLISREGKYTPGPKRNIQPKPTFNRERHKTLLVRNVNRIKKFYEDRQGQLLVTDDKGNNEFKITFIGSRKPDFIKKYGIEVYKVKQDRKENEIVYGRISNKKLDGQTHSQFERLQRDIVTYKESDKDKGKTNFDYIREIKPLELEEIIEPELLGEMRSSSDTEHFVDISFVGTTEDVARKLTIVSEKYGERFVSKINRDALHFCRVHANFNEIEETVNELEGITKIEKSPSYIVELSSFKKQSQNISVINPPSTLTPAIVFDTDVNQNHFALKGALDDVLNNDGSEPGHGTAVASLVINGRNLVANGTLQQDNRVIAIKVSQNNFLNLESIIEDAVKKYSLIYKVLIINLSINTYHLAYTRVKGVDKLTILLDDLANKYNCLFVVSAGNLFKNWPRDLVTKCLQKGYPHYFTEKFARILPPADSINNISVGSIAFAETADSMAKINSPVAHTRGNLDKFPFIKPDLVNYDSNYKTDFTCEDNGPLMAHQDNDTLTSMGGTSFAAPLVAHDLSVLHNQYPDLTTNSLKGLIIHFANRDVGQGIASKKIRERMIGFGIPQLERTLHSTNHSSTIIIEDEIVVGGEKDCKQKTVRFPIPASIAGDSHKRLRIRKTLVYNPVVNTKNHRIYNPLIISAQLVRCDNANIAGRNTKDTYGGAHTKSNVQHYPPIDKNTKEHTGRFWELKIICENKDELMVPADYKQKYSVILTIEDIKEVEGVDLHEEIQNMIEVETHVSVPVEVVSGI